MSNKDDSPSSESSSGSSGRSVRLDSIESVFQAELARTFGEENNPDIELRSEFGESLSDVRLEKLRASSEGHQRYQIKGEIGRGGMGAVLKIFDTDLRRELAMKVILTSGGQLAGASKSTSPQLVRFLEEAQVTGQLDHPGVVPVHELGVDAEGHVYFTMRLVKGQELALIIEKVHDGDPEWNLTRALGVLLKVCEAMSYAHNKGVIHRDLKPANIMVGRHGQVYVMDWGLARVEGREDRHELRLQTDPMSFSVIQTDRNDSEAQELDSPIMTMDGQVVGTPFYMPPEQAAGRLEDIGPHSDVYALGSMLYHLLTGRAPYYTPGSRVSIHTVLALVLQGPPTPVHELGPLVSPELEAICEKAMAREISERYADMGELAEDLRAYLENRVVHAYRTGAVIELKKWVKRNRALAATVAAAIALIVGGSMTATVVVGTKNEAIRVARDEALDAEGQANDAREDALAAKARAEEARDSSKSISDFLVSQFEALKAETTGGRPVQVSELLDRAAESLDGTMGNSPREAAKMRAVVGNAYVSIGLYEPAGPLLERAWKDRIRLLGEADPNTLASLNDLAKLHFARGMYAEAEPLSIQALAKRREVLGEDHPDTLTSLNDLALVYASQGRYEESESLFLQALEKRRALGLEDPGDEITSMDGLAALYQRQGRYEEAEELLQQGLEMSRTVLGENHVTTLHSLNTLAVLHLNRGRFAEAAPLFLDALQKCQAVLGTEHPRTIISQRDLALCYLLQDRAEQAAPLATQALEKSRVVLGEDHVHTLIAMAYLARIREQQGRLGEAESLFLRVLEKKRAVRGEDHHDTLVSLSDLGLFYLNNKQLDKAETILTQALDRKSAVLGPDNPSTLTAQHSLAELFSLQGRFESAEPLYLQSLEKRRALLGDEHPHTRSSLDSLLKLYEAWLPELRADPGEDDPQTLAVIAKLAVLLVDAGRNAEAEPLLLECLDKRLAVLGEEHADTLETFHLLAMLYARQGRPEEAEPLFLECIELRRKVLGASHASTLASREELLRLYVSASRWSAASPLARELVELTPEDSPDHARRSQMNELVILGTGQN